MNAHQELKQALHELESCMEEAGMWQMATPPASAFSSEQPFSADTMSLPEWLRFVFIARLHALADAQAPMPMSCDVTPALEAYLTSVPVSPPYRSQLCQSVTRIDRLITDN
ncbi:YqcC family protein [Halomonas halocynthiae]|uniref:YqcC family protein n=1 Tax=Halomonas halocynthiae TaxID=176290 RepID=UPI00040ED04F|nr:YqcC family protein [Halomonas halocynthiae]